MAYISWTRYTFEGGKTPVSEVKYQQLVQLSEREFPSAMAEMRRARWARFREAHVGKTIWWWGPVVAGVALFIIRAQCFPTFNAWAEGMTLAGGLMIFWTLYRSISLGFSAASHNEALSAECHHLERAHALARVASGYEDYRAKHAAELAGATYLSHDSRLAVLIAVLGLLVVTIPICAPVAILLGYLGLRKRKRYSMAAIVLGVVELIGFTILMISMRDQ